MIVLADRARNTTHSSSFIENEVLRWGSEAELVVHSVAPMCLGATVLLIQLDKDTTSFPRYESPCLAGGNVGVVSSIFPSTQAKHLVEATALSSSGPVPGGHSVQDEPVVPTLPTSQASHPVAARSKFGL